MENVSGGVFTNEATVLCREEWGLPLCPLSAVDRALDSCLAKPRPLISTSLCPKQMEILRPDASSVLANEGLLRLTARPRPAYPEVARSVYLGHAGHCDRSVRRSHNARWCTNANTMSRTHAILMKDRRPC